MDRYSRQIELIGSHQQERLHDARVLVVGTGGLGSPTLMALAVSGIGTIGLVDYDTVDLSNLNRQILHDESYIGTDKTVSAQYRLKQMNKDIEINTYTEKLSQDRAEVLFSKYDVIVDCVDNYETRKIVSTVATKLNKAVIEGGIEGFNGYVQIVVPGKTACFNCLAFGENEIYRQVLGAGTGIVGNMQALECIKLLTGLYTGDYSYISIDLMTYEIDTLRLENNESCSCYTGKEVLTKD